MNAKAAGRRLGFVDALGALWFTLDGATHLTMELGYLWVALTTTAAAAPRGDGSLFAYFGWLWRVYGAADARWAVRDPGVISLEILTACVFGPLCLLQVYAIVSRKPWRHFLQTIICVAELYGGWMTFAPEWIEGNPNLRTDDPLLLWVYLVFMNGVWVVIPAILLWESGARIVKACDQVKMEGSDERKGIPGLPSIAWHRLIALTLVLYAALVPAVIMTARDPLA